MKILIHSKDVTLDDDLQKAIHTKIGRVRKYAPDAQQVRVQVRRERIHGSNQFVVSVYYEIPGRDLYAEHAAVDPLTALDSVAEKIERRLRKRKTAFLARRVAGGRGEKNESAEDFDLLPSI